MNAARNGAVAGSGADSGPGTRAVSPMADADQLPGMISGLSRQNSVYRRMMAVCDRVAGAAVQGADAPELTRIFAATAGKTVMLLDPEFRPQAQAGSGATAGPMQRWEPGDASIASMLRVLASERKPLRVPPVPGSALPYGCLATPVMVGEAVLAYLLVLDETVTEADDIDLVITSYAATLFALTLAREQTSLELGQRYQGAILDALVSGHFLDSHDARRKARSLGVADAEPYRVAVARVNAHRAVPGRTGDRGSAEEALSRLAGSVRCAAVIRGPELVMLLPEQPDGSAPDRGGGTTTVPVSHVPLLFPPQAAGNQLTCGLSEPTERPELAPRALLQAQHAIDLGIRIGRAGQTISYSELGIYRLLLQIGDMHQLWQFAEDVLGPLIDHDARHKVDLFSTLSIYLNQHESLKQTARVLRVHVNTVSYRIQRIEGLTSLDLANPDHRLSAHVAAKIIESRMAAEH
ncbi:MAG: helix-turn-helix domain-containing protein [Streptosporangiaceae bacterium]